MDFISRLDCFHQQARHNQWLRYFTVFNRLALAAGFIMAGLVKVMGERFASGLSVNHPMGQYLEALSHTGYYYTFIGVLQILAAILLLIPRMATLGALLYFPLILNILILSLAVRFEGSLLSAPLMTLANMYLLCWDYDKLKCIVLPSPPLVSTAAPLPAISRKFPVRFFGGAALAVVAVVAVLTNVYNIMPRNSFADCNRQFAGTSRTSAGRTFCDCIHNQGKPLADCLTTYEHAADDGRQPTLKP